AGAYLSNGNVSVSFTLGEVAVTTLRGSNLILTQGFQQPFELDVGTAVQNLPVNWAVEAYPNPVTEYLNIRFSLEKEEDFILQVTDLSGRKLIVKRLFRVAPGQVEQLDLTGFSPGIYLVSVTSSDRKIMRMYKVEKR
ncbi:MAG: T9SS type A sorting domain-containing protein, partial [Chlorobi bacterium]|nr:T9SS type A sorting domain-containing protein [Chlorobiota bacterium]